MEEKPIILGVDIGGLHITAALIDLERREIVPESLNSSTMLTASCRDKCFAERDYKKMLGLTLGTGLSSALCKEGGAEDADLWKRMLLLLIL